MLDKSRIYMSDKPVLSELRLFKSNVLTCTKYSNSKSQRLPIMLGSIAVSLMLLSGCDSAKDGTYEESADYASEDTASIETFESEQSAVASLESDASNSPIKLKVENQTGDSEQTLGSQATDIQIKGKELLITANANFKVEDVVRCS